MLSERRLPYGYSLLRLCAARLHRVAQRGIPLRERVAIPLQREEVRARRECEEDVEIPTSRGRRARHELDVGGREQYAGQGTECIAQPLRLGAAELHALALALAFEASGDLVIRSAVRAGRQVKTRGAEANDVGIARASDGPEKVQIVNGLEQVRLSLSVVADDDDARLRKGEIEPSKVAKVPQRERSQ